MIVHPIIRSSVTMLLVEQFGATPEVASSISDRLIKGLHSKGLDIVRGNWMEGGADRGGPMTWNDLAGAADDLVKERNGIKPWAPPELR